MAIARLRASSNRSSRLSAASESVLLREDMARGFGRPRCWVCCCWCCCACAIVVRPLLLDSLAYEGVKGEVEDGRRVEGGGGRRGRVVNIVQIGMEP